jgi:hypothetical protein
MSGAKRLLSCSEDITVQKPKKKKLNREKVYYRLKKLYYS